MATKEAEYLVNITLQIPSRMLYRLTKEAIQSKDVKLVAANWDNIRLIKEKNGQNEN